MTTTINGVTFLAEDIHTGTDGTDKYIGVSRSELFYGSADVDIFFDADPYDNYSYRYYAGTATWWTRTSPKRSFDLIDYSASPAGVTIDMALGVGLGGDAHGDRYQYIEGIIGSTFDDTFYGMQYHISYNSTFSPNDPRAEYFFGGKGDDIAYGYAGADTLRGGNGDDRLYGGNHDDTLDGGNGNDSLAGNSGRDVLYGRYGDDHLDAGSDDDTLWGHDGADTLLGGSGNDRLYGGNGHDVLFGDETTELPSDGGDFIYGGGGNDTIHGGGGDDQLYGDSGADRIWGGHGNDYISAGGGFDRVDAGAGDDIVWLGDGGDFFSAAIDQGAGDDEVHGEGGNDFLHTGRGADRLFGGAGDDVLDGGSGSDVLTGGAGADAFHFYLNSDADRITDFSVEEGDTIWLASAIGPIVSRVEGDSAFILLRDEGHAFDIIELQGIGADELALIVDDIHFL